MSKEFLERLEGLLEAYRQVEQRWKDFFSVYTRRQSKTLGWCIRLCGQNGNDFRRRFRRRRKNYWKPKSVFLRKRSFPG